MHRIDLVLINPPLTLTMRYGKMKAAANTLPSLGLLSLASVVREAGYTVAIIEAASLGLDAEQVVTELTRLSPRCVGLTATTLSVHSAGELARLIKQRLPSSVVILGGPHVTAVPEETLAVFPEIDFAVVGEGERTLAELLQTLGSGGDLSGVQGLVFRNGQGIERTAPRPIMVDLDELPMPAWDLLPRFPWGYRPPPFRFRRLPAASVVTSRGCPTNCIFCDRSVFGSKCRGFRPAYVQEMLARLVKDFGVREILFEDDTIFVFKNRLRELCEALIRKGPRLSWSCLGRVDMVDPELLGLMRRAGCWQVSYGLESGNQQVLDFIGKRFHLDQAYQALAWTKEAGMQTKGFFILGHPTETRATLQNTLAFAKKAALDDISVFMLTPFPGSRLYEVADQYGAFEKDWERMNLLDVVFVPQGLTRTDLKQFSARMLKEFYLRPRILKSYARKVLVDPTKASAMVRGGFAFLRGILQS